MSDLLDEAYRYCGNLTATHGRTYHLASRLLPPDRRAGVHALYGFARTVDDIVDVAAVDDPARAGREVDAVLARLYAALDGDPGPADDVGLVVRAVADTITRYRIPLAHFDAFVRSMRMDVPGTAEFRDRYRDMAELQDYMYGSASVIGLQLLPVFGVDDPDRAAPYAAALGTAFQLTNFVRDVGEDMARGRIYLPADGWAAFGVDDDLLVRCKRTGVPDPRVRRALAHFVALARADYRRAEPGLELLPDRVRPGIRAAFVLYGRILDEVEDGGYRVFDRRAVVPRRRRVAVLLTQLASRR